MYGVPLSSSGGRLKATSSPRPTDTDGTAIGSMKSVLATRRPRLRRRRTASAAQVPSVSATTLATRPVTRLVTSSSPARFCTASARCCVVRWLGSTPFHWPATDAAPTMKSGSPNTGRNRAKNTTQAMQRPSLDENSTSTSASREHESIQRVERDRQRDVDHGHHASRRVVELLDRLAVDDHGQRDHAF